MCEAIEAMREAFAQISRGEVNLPTRLQLEASAAGGALLVMPCLSTSAELFSTKLITVFEENARHGLPMIQSMVFLADAATGSPVALLDGASLTAIRTGAASGLATDLLARPDATTAAIIGAGVQARTQLEAVCCVRDIEHARVYDRDAESAERFAVEMREQLGVVVEPAASAAAAVKNAGIVCTVTNAKSPVFEDCHLSPGTHINAVGAFRPDMIEVPAATVCRARVVVDHLAAALEEAGDLLAPLLRRVDQPAADSHAVGRPGAGHQARPKALTTKSRYSNPWAWQFRICAPPPTLLPTLGNWGWERPLSDA